MVDRVPGFLTEDEYPLVHAAQAFDVVGLRHERHRVLLDGFGQARGLWVSGGLRAPRRRGAGHRLRTRPPSPEGRERSRSSAPPIPRSWISARRGSRESRNWRGRPGDPIAWGWLGPRSSP